MTLHFVVNPRAGRIRGRAVEAALRREFPGREIRISGDPPHRGSRNADEVGAVVAVGGDGTVNRLLDFARVTGIPMGVLPCGTANDFARALGIPGDFPRACAVLRNGRVLAVDLATVEGVPFVTCGGIGLAADAAARVNRWKRGRAGAAACIGVLGCGVYLLAALASIGRNPEPYRVRIRGGSHVEDRTVASVLLGNQAQFGGRFSVSPEASNQDGFLELCGIDAPVSRARLLRIALAMLGSGPGRCPGVFLGRGPSFEIVCERGAEFFGDGEVLATGRRFHVRTLPGALRVIVPGRPQLTPGIRAGGIDAR